MAAASASAHTSAAGALEGVLLPTDVTPSRYDIALEPDLVACTFRGSVSITVTVHRATKSVVLHAHTLTVGHVATFTPAPSGADKPKAVSATHISYDLAAQTVTLAFADALPVGGGKLALSFSGVLNDELAGFYRSKYTIRGETRYMAVTQFEATDARRCFPCWDEPAHKAVFGITVTAPADRVTISNMHPLRTDTSHDGKKRTTLFADTPKMSTYLVAVIVGEFDSVAQMDDGLLTTVYTPPGKSDLGVFALGVGIRAIKYLTELFGIKYMGSKVDHIAIPDFAAGAMENTGAITYREAALLIDEKESSVAMRQRVAQVVSHELSHQWFGNLTTMKWWTDLFLNEGFAKMMEYVVTSRLFPEWNTFAHFTSTVQSAAFALDSMASTHPIEVEVKHPDEINEVFDAISYNKGASVLRMLFNWIGHDTGFKGLHRYLSEHAYKNTVTQDLWTALEQESGKPVKKVMQNWTSQPGFPYLYVTTSDRSGGAFHRNSIKLESRRCIAPWALNATAWPSASDFPSGPSFAAVQAARDAWMPVGGPASNDDWCIPLSFQVASSTGTVATHDVGVLMLDAAASEGTPRPDTLETAAARIGELAASSHAHWIKLNANHGSFVRTIYDSSLLVRLAPAVSTPADRSHAPALGVVDRVGLIGDAATAFAIGFTSAADVLTLVWAFRYETDFYVWQAILDAVDLIKSTAETVSAAHGRALEAFVRALLRPAVELLGWETRPGEEPNAPQLRALVLRWAAIVGDAAVIAESNARFDAYVAGKGTIAPDLKQTVYNTVAAVGDEARWDTLYNMMKKATLSEEQRRLMIALGRTTRPALMQRALRLVLSDDVRGQDGLFLVHAVATNPGSEGAAIAWQWFKDSWETINAKFSGGNFIWSGIVGGATSNFGTREQAEDVLSFFETRPTGSADRKIKQNVESTRSRAWRAAIMRNDPTNLVAAVESLIATA